MLTTKGITSGNGNSKAKTLKPGNVKARLYGLFLLSGYNPGSYHLILNIESEPVGEGFEGFFIDKNDESLGRFKGQIGRVRYSQYAFEDKKFDNGNEIFRDQGILKALSTLAKALGVSEELNEIKADTIEEFVAAAQKVLCGSDVYIHFCLAGKEYLKGEYTNYDLFLPRTKGSVYAYSEEAKGVVVFDPKDHIIALPKAAPNPIEGFGAPSTDEPLMF
jgi:hypothetical protein